MATWCQACFADGRPVPLLEGLDTYLALLDRAYWATGSERSGPHQATPWGTRRIAGSAYLGATVPESAEVHAILGTALREAGRLDEAVTELETAVRLAPRSARVYNDLGIALAMQGKLQEAIEQFERALEAQPDFAQAQQNLATARRQHEQRAVSGR